MTLWSTASVGKEKKFLELYTLKMLSRKPQTGYSLLKDIERKTNGRWVPSKGMVYPLLDEMEERGLIELHAVGERSKKIYKITEKGLEELNLLRGKRKEIQKTLDTFSHLFFETFLPAEEVELANLFHALRRKAMDSSDKEKAKKVLQRAMEELS